MSQDRALVIFGREPIAGKTKTRLAATLGAEKATEIYRALLAHTISSARDCDASLTFSLADEPSAAFSSSLDISIEVQSPGELGERMMEALTKRFDEGFDRALIIGTDCLGLEPRHLDTAFVRLDEAPLVFGPAADGGYWTVAQRGPVIDVFSGVPWSDPHTLEASLERARSLGVEAVLLETLVDADTETELRRALAAGQVVPSLAATIEELLA